MELEISRIQHRMGGPEGVQYSLRATESGCYPNVRGGTMYLKEGDVWKYGETTNPSDRYSQSQLIKEGLAFVPEFYGNQTQIKVEEKLKIYGYFLTHGHLPPGNRIFR